MRRDAGGKPETVGRGRREQQVRSPAAGAAAGPGARTEAQRHGVWRWAASGIPLEQGGGEDTGRNPDHLRCRRGRSHSGVGPALRSPPGPIAKFLRIFFLWKKHFYFILKRS